MLGEGDALGVGAVAHQRPAPKTHGPQKLLREREFRLRWTQLGLQNRLLPANGVLEKQPSGLGVKKPLGQLLFGLQFATEHRQSTEQDKGGRWCRARISAKIAPMIVSFGALCGNSSYDETKATKPATGRTMFRNRQGEVNATPPPFEGSLCCLASVSFEFINYIYPPK